MRLITLLFSGLLLACYMVTTWPGLNKISKPALQLLVYWEPAITLGEWYRLLSFQLIHADAAHITMNLLTVVIVGWFLEPSIGSMRLAVITVLSLAINALGCLLWFPPDQITLGASGVAYAWLFAYLSLSVAQHWRAGRTNKAMKEGRALLIYTVIMALMNWQYASEWNVLGHAIGAAFGVLWSLITVWLLSRQSSLLGQQVDTQA